MKHVEVTYLNLFYRGIVYIRLFAMAPSQHRMFEECRKRLCILYMQILCTPAHCPPLTNGILPWHFFFPHSCMAVQRIQVFFFSVPYVQITRSFTRPSRGRYYFFRAQNYLPLLQDKCIFVLFHMYHHIHVNFTCCLTPSVF